MKSQIPEPASARYGSGAKSGVISRASNAAVASFLVLCGTVPYVNTLFNGFVYDDNTQVMNNPYIQSFRYLREIFSTTVWSYVGVLRGTNYYRPMMTFGYLLAYQFFGPLAYGFHLTNILLHTDRKSTRLNSSHSQISYAVFCLKKKKSALDSPTTAPSA